MSWSREYLHCVECKKTIYKHVILGYCKDCYETLDEDNPLHKKKSKTIRECLKCGTTFTSKGIGNRRCEICLRKEKDSPIKGNRYRVSIG